MILQYTVNISETNNGIEREQLKICATCCLERLDSQGSKTAGIYITDILRLQSGNCLSQTTERNSNWLQHHYH